MPYDVTIPVGCPWSMTLTLRDVDNNPIDITNYSWHGAVMNGDVQVVGLTFYIPFPLTGQVIVCLTSSQTTIGGDHDYTYLVTADNHSDSPFTLIEGAANFRVDYGFADWPVTVKQRGTFYSLYNITKDQLDVDLTGYLAVCRIRNTKNDTSVISQPLVKISPPGRVQLDLSFLDTSVWSLGDYYYDLFVTDGYNAFFVAKGAFSVQPYNFP